MSDEVHRKVAAYLQTITSRRNFYINPETEIYGDLKIYGFDLFELLVWIENEFGVQIVISGKKYAPSEMPFLDFFEAIKKKFGGERYRYKSLRVCDLVQLIDAGGGRLD